MTAQTIERTGNLKANDNKSFLGSGTVQFPVPPLASAEPLEMEIYARFMRHMRLVPNSRLEIKILSAIQFTADMMDLNDALVAKTLADLGLRAPRHSFPESYLDHVDRSLMRSGWDVGGPSASSLEMKDHWDRIGEDKFAAFRRDYSVLSEPMRV